MLDRNTWTGIPNGDVYARVVGCGAQSHKALLGCVTDGVRGEILQRLFETSRIAEDPRRPGRDLELQRNVALALRPFMTISDSLEQIFDGDRFGFRAITATFQAREVEEIADDRFQLVCFLFDDVEIALPRVVIDRHV